MKLLYKLTILLLFIFLKLNGIFAQVNIYFKPIFAKEKLVLNKQYLIANTFDSIQIETFKFYVSNIEFYNNEQLVFKEKNSFHLVDASDSNTFKVNPNESSDMLFNKIIFNIGIDSITNYAGALGGNLDPTKGMYWTWQNGYINFKIEGKSNLCNTSNNEFTFHLGGYQNPFNTLQNIQLNTNNSNAFDINIAVDKWFAGFDFKNQNHIMSPCNEAVLLSNKLSTIFSVSQ